MGFLFLAFLFIVAAAVIVAVAISIASHRFRCRHCSKAFRINWTKVITTEHSGSEYMLVCPFCKTKDWCTEQPKIVVSSKQ